MAAEVMSQPESMSTWSLGQARDPQAQRKGAQEQTARDGFGLVTMETAPNCGPFYQRGHKPLGGSVGLGRERLILQLPMVTSPRPKSGHQEPMFTGALTRDWGCHRRTQHSHLAEWVKRPVGEVGLAHPEQAPSYH